MTTSNKALLDGAAAEGRTFLLEHEGYALLEEIGIATPRHFFVTHAEEVTEADLESLSSGQVVLKVVSPDVLHKSDVGGVRFVPNELAPVRAAVRDILATVAERAVGADLRGVLVLEKVEIETNLPGREFLLSCRRDPAFGPVLMFGIGGLLTEWYGELSGGGSHLMFSALDFDADRSLEAVASTPMGWMALQPGRLHPEAPVARASLGRAMTALADFASLEMNGPKASVEEIEINPVAALDGGLVALDALIRVAVSAPARRAPRPIGKVHELLHPRSAVVYGASTRSQNAGRIILRNLKVSDGITYGQLFAIHPEAKTIDGIPCFPSARDLPRDVDLAIVCIPAHVAPAVIEELVTLRKAKSIILIPGGFAETGHREHGDRIQRTLRESRDTEDGGPVMVGGNCLGIVSKGEYNTFFLPSYKLPFSNAPGESLVVVSQSGAYLVTFTSNHDGIIFPRASISYGNEMDLTANDFLEYYLDQEPDVEVFGFYVEGFQPGEGERFLRLIRRARAMDKAVLVYKAGQTQVGARAAASHTASIAGDYEVARALLQESGALVCDTLNMFEDYTKILTMLKQHRPRGRRVGVITNAGFEAGAVSDHLYGLELAAFGDETRARLAEVLPDIAHVGNPVDCTPMTRTASFIQAVEIMAAAPEVDALVVSAVPATPALDILAPDLVGRHEENIFALKSLPKELIRVFQTMKKPLVMAIDSGRLYDPSVMVLERAGIPVYRKIDRASRALSAFMSQQLR